MVDCTPPLPHGADSLGRKLSPFLDGGFFRPLSRLTAAVYVDCAERLVEAADAGGQVDHAGARVLIRDVLVSHPDVQLDEDEDEGGQHLPGRQVVLLPRRESCSEN